MQVHSHMANAKRFPKAEKSVCSVCDHQCFQSLRCVSCSTLFSERLYETLWPVDRFKGRGLGDGDRARAMIHRDDDDAR